MKHIVLLATSMIAGLPRSPVEGVQYVSDDEAERLVEAKQAKYADIEDDDEDEDEDDGNVPIDKKTVDQLKAMMVEAGLVIPDKAKKPDLIKALHDRADGLDQSTDEHLRKIVEDEKVTIPNNADRAAVITAIREKRASA